MVSIAPDNRPRLNRFGLIDGDIEARSFWIGATAMETTSMETTAMGVC